MASTADQIIAGGASVRVTADFVGMENTLKDDRKFLATIDSFGAQASYRLTDAMGRAGAQQGEKAGQQTADGVLKGINKMFGRGSDLAMMARIFRGSGPVIALELISKALESATSEMVKLNEAAILTDKTAAQLAGDFTASLPIIGHIYTAMKNLAELFTGIEFSKKINDILSTNFDTFRKNIVSLLEVAKGGEKTADARIRKMKEELADKGLAPGGKELIHAGNSFNDSMRQATETFEDTADKLKQKTMTIKDEQGNEHTVGLDRAHQMTIQQMQDIQAKFDANKEYLKDYPNDPIVNREQETLAGGKNGGLLGNLRAQKSAIEGQQRLVANLTKEAEAKKDEEERAAIALNLATVKETVVKGWTDFRDAFVDGAKKAFDKGLKETDKKNKEKSEKDAAFAKSERALAESLITQHDPMAKFRERRDETLRLMSEGFISPDQGFGLIKKFLGEANDQIKEAADAADKAAHKDENERREKADRILSESDPLEKYKQKLAEIDNLTATGELTGAQRKTAGNHALAEAMKELGFSSREFSLGTSNPLALDSLKLPQADMKASLKSLQDDVNWFRLRAQAGQLGINFIQ